MVTQTREKTMQALLTVILPVFLVIGFGYVSVWRGWFSESGVDGLMKFTQNFAIPCLLFSAIAGLDLGQNFDLAMLAAFYTGALAGFLAAMFAARFVFGRDWPDSVAIGFIGLFSNSVLLGLPITERAFGPEALAANYMIVALHAPFCYGVGITAMEIARNQGSSLVSSVPRILKAMFRNALVIGIGLGFVVNLGQIPLPLFLTDALALMSRAALPAALFGLGGVLVRYRPEGDMRLILVVVAISLVLHPAITFTLAKTLEVGTDGFRSAVLTAAMAPGVNAYVFANMYGVGKRVAASSVLIATALTVLTGWLWLMTLP
jgi:malonate transporter and related proteins